METGSVCSGSGRGLTWVPGNFERGANHIRLVPSSESLDCNLSCVCDVPGLDRVEVRRQHTVFHCGTALKDGNVVTNGGRVLIVVVLAEQLISAVALATRACGDIEFDGRQYRKDIGHRGVSR